jgi:hypothetical protein
MCYLGALTTYYVNKIAKNQYMDTADIFETMHSLARLRGYDSQGYRSDRTTLTITVSGSDFAAGDVLYIPAWKKIETTITDVNDSAINFSTIKYITTTIPATASFPYIITDTVEVPVRQGNIQTLTYEGTDIIDNKINLPMLNYDYDDDINDTDVSIELVVNDDLWTRVADFYNLISGLETTDTVYKMRYDKYERYIIEFASFRDVPAEGDTITIKLLETLGADGGAGAGTITTPETEFIYNYTQSKWCDNEQITVTNSTATVGGMSPDTIEEIRDNSESSLNIQRRCVTANDYEEFLEERSDVVAAKVWGEQEVAPSGSIYEYNKVYISVVPDEWGTGTILTSAASADILEPYQYVPTYRAELASYLEPRKMLNAYESWVVPDLVYLSYKIGFKAKRTYDATLVALEIQDKLTYYFNASNRQFNELLSHTDIVDFILDTSQESSTDSFPYIAGIDSLIVRDVNIINKTLYDYNTIGNYPMYEVTTSSYTSYDNKLNNIQLGFNQFPALYVAGCTVTLEL